MRINQLTFVAFQLNGALGSSNYGEVTIEQVKKEIRAGTIFQYLERKLGKDLDLSIVSPEERKELMDEWDGMADSINEGRKLCVVNNGLSLLIAYLLEGIQERAPKLEK